MREAAPLKPPIVWLAIWNRQLRQERQQQQRADNEDDNDNDDHNDDDNDFEERAGVLYSRVYRKEQQVFNDNDFKHEQDLSARRIGLAQGLIDFTRSFTQRPSASRASGDEEGTDTDSPTDEQDVNIHKQIKVVHSQNQRLVFLQPEQDYWIVAAFDRYITKPSKTHSRDNSASSSVKDVKGKKTAIPQQARIDPSSFLSNEVFIDLLKRAYAEFRLFNGTFSHCLETRPYETLRLQLKTFFEDWYPTARLLPLGIPRCPVSSSSSFKLRPPQDATIVAVSHKGFHSITTPESSSAPTLSPADIIALSSHLSTLLPAPPPDLNLSAKSNDSKTSKEKKKTTNLKKQSSLGSASAWRNFGLGGISNYMPAMPSMPGSSTFSGSSKAIPPIPPVSSEMGSETARDFPPMIAHDPADNAPIANTAKGKRATSGSAWLPSFGLFGGTSSGSKPAAIEPIIKSNLRTSTQLRIGTSHDLHEGGEHAISSRQLEDPPDSAASTLSLEALSQAISEDITPAQTVITSVVAEAELSNPVAALSDVEIKDVKDDAPSEPTTAALHCEWLEVVDVFVNERFEEKRCYRVITDQMVVAFIVNAAQGANADEGETVTTSRRSSSTPGVSNAAEVTIDRDQKGENEVADNEDVFDKSQAEQYLVELVADLSSSSTGPTQSGASASIKTKRTYLSFASNSCTEVIERTIDNRASAGTASSAQRSTTMVNARTDTDKLMKLGVKEVYLRNHFAHWLVGMSDGNTDGSKELTILPKSIGREGSLLDAEAEMQASH